MAHLYDYAWAQLSSPAMAAVHGCVGVMRYGNGTKALTPAERDNHHAAGLGIGLIHEAAATDLEHPERAAGIAREANDLWDKLGAPRDVPIFYCHDANDGQVPNVVQSYQTLHAVSARPAGLYGSVADLEGALPTYGWQVETWVGAHPRGYISPQAHLVQMANTHDPVIPGVDASQYDTNHLIRPFPLWGGTAPLPAPVTGGTVDIYWRSDVKGPGGAWPYRIIQGSTIVYEATGGPDPTFGLPLDYIGWYSAQSSELKATIHPILANATVWDALTAADQAVRAHGGGVDAAALAAAVASKIHFTITAS